MSNSRGQSLVLFILILPVILLIFVFLVDVAQAINLKFELKNISDIVIDYGLDYMSDGDLATSLENYIKMNNDGIDKIKINVENDKIYIELNEKYEGILSSLVDIPIFDVKTSYVGYIINDEKRIENLGD